MTDKNRIRVWRKLASAKWPDAWEERLRHVGLDRLAIIRMAGGKSLRIEVYHVTEKEGKELIKAFGGEIRSLPGSAWMPAPAADAKPILIRDQLVVAPNDTVRKQVRKKYPGRACLLMPAAMAFGTGEHPTTASCLRFLSDEAQFLEGMKWKFIDLGTGTGVLALAATVLGAAKSEGFDFDPHAVRTAKENAKLNGDSRTKLRKGDVLDWQPKEEEYDVIAANLFSELLINCAPKIFRGVRSGGAVILSGILRTQEEETIAAFQRAGLELVEVIRKGKWIGVFLRKP